MCFTYSITASSTTRCARLGSLLCLLTAGLLHWALGWAAIVMGQHCLHAHVVEMRNCMIDYQHTIIRKNYGYLESITIVNSSEKHLSAHKQTGCLFEEPVQTFKLSVHLLRFWSTHLHAACILYVCIPNSVDKHETISYMHLIMFVCDIDLCTWRPVSQVLTCNMRRKSWIMNRVE
jgi:hypothetical protein